MPVRARVVQPAASPSYEIVNDTKPTPPDDLWEKLDAIVTEAMPYTSNSGEGGFTIREYMEHRGLTSRDTAYGQLNRLVRLGKLKAGWAIKADEAGRGRHCRVYYIVE